MGFERPQRKSAQPETGTADQMESAPTPHFQKPMDFDTASKEDLIIRRGSVILKMYELAKTEPLEAQAFEKVLKIIDEKLETKHDTVFD